MSDKQISRFIFAIAAIAIIIIVVHFAWWGGRNAAPKGGMVYTIIEQKPLPPDGYDLKLADGETYFHFPAHTRKIVIEFPDRVEFEKGREELREAERLLPDLFTPVQAEDKITTAADGIDYGLVDEATYAGIVNQRSGKNP